ncbi:MAG: nitrate- and nitrite sensing domain-containing protein [SAR324 cluster bacterium]|nr:nitrate- and nitrite sensing domain-containing protein [SAR324 cluster bacterium]
MSIKDLKIGSKLVLMVLIPLLGLIYFTVNETIEQVQLARNMNRLEKLIGLAIRLSAVVHEIQKERGMSAGYIGSSGKDFLKQLQQQRPVTDDEITRLEKYLDTLDTNFIEGTIQSKLDEFSDVLKKRDSIRDDVLKLNISAMEEIQYYTQLNHSIFVIVGYLPRLINNSELSNMLIAYVNFMQAKENAGIERATLSNTFSQKSFGKGMYEQFISSIVAQNIFINNFLSLVPPSMISVYHSTLKGSYVDDLENMRKFSFEKRFENITIDPLK